MAEVFFLPYLGEVPAEMLQHHGLHQFTVTCHQYSIVASTIEEDSQFIGARMLDIQHSYIHTQAAPCELQNETANRLSF